MSKLISIQDSDLNNPTTNSTNCNMSPQNTNALSFASKVASERLKKRELT